MSDIDDLFADLEDQQQHQGDSLKQLAELIKLQMQHEDKIDEAEKELDALKASLREISEKRIPELMLSLNIKTIVHESGANVACEKFYAGSISEERAPAAFEWLREKGLEDLIKRALTVNFGMGQEQEAESLSGSLEQQGLDFKDKANVHPQTLKALIKERLESGQELPMDLFGVVTGMKTKIKRPKLL